MYGASYYKVELEEGVLRTMIKVLFICHGTL